jgi:hypothetical protein
VTGVLLTDAQIRERDGDRCSKCGRTSGPLDVHHRWMRSAGSDDRACNRLTLCRGDHDWVHRNPQAARLGGWLLSRYADPARIPVSHTLWPAGPILLLDDGGIQIWQEESET